MRKQKNKINRELRSSNSRRQMVQSEVPRNGNTNKIIKIHQVFIG